MCWRWQAVCYWILIDARKSREQPSTSTTTYRAGVSRRGDEDVDSANAIRPTWNGWRANGEGEVACMWRSSIWSWSLRFYSHSLPPIPTFVSHHTSCVWARSLAANTYLRLQLALPIQHCQCAIGHLHQSIRRLLLVARHIPRKTKTQANEQSFLQHPTAHSPLLTFRSPNPTIRPQPPLSTEHHEKNIFVLESPPSATVQPWRTTARHPTIWSVIFHRRRLQRWKGRLRIQLPFICYTYYFWEFYFIFVCCSWPTRNGKTGNWNMEKKGRNHVLVLLCRISFVFLCVSWSQPARDGSDEGRKLFFLLTWGHSSLSLLIFSYSSMFFLFLVLVLLRLLYYITYLLRLLDSSELVEN